MRAADDFKNIRRRMLDLRRGPRADPADCDHRSFDPETGRCEQCNIHLFHLPAVTPCGARTAAS